jgi:4-aminobutyrate aminotransferase-like enzyme
LRALREQADRLRVPIFADEILTGGGRTGKFWAFQHYPDFYPDLITFGKGLALSGVATITRINHHARMWDFAWAGPGPGGLFLDNTSLANAMVMRQSIQILRRIRTGRLIENAADTGAYFLEKLRIRAKRLGVDPNEVTGIGLLLNGGVRGNELMNSGVSNYRNRWTPPITLSRSEADALVDTSPRRNDSVLIETSKFTIWLISTKI